MPTAVALVVVGTVMVNKAATGWQEAVIQGAMCHGK